MSSLVINGIAVPLRSLGTGGGCQFRGPLLRIPSKAGGEEGIVVRVSAPSQPRYPEGAPVAVLFTGGGGVDRAPGCGSEAGFVDVTFLCPGTQSGKQPDGTVWKSGGTPSPDVKTCTEPLADVLAFASGNLRSTEGKNIGGYVPGMRVLTGNAGITGFSIGGNVAVDAMAKYGERFPDLKWYASFEAPSALHFSDEGNALHRNRFYNPAGMTIDFATLQYVPDMPVQYFPTFLATLPAEAKSMRGNLVLDGGAFGSEATYPLLAEYWAGPPAKAFYSVAVTREAERRHVFGDSWPSHIATREESERFSAAVEGQRMASVKASVKRFPRLAVLRFQSREDHVGDDLQYGTATAELDAFQHAGVHWLRLNPDVSYIEWAMGRKPSAAIQNPAGKRFTPAEMGNAVEPEARDGGPTDKEGMLAAMAELADRTQQRDWSPLLKHVLISYTPGVQ